MPTITDLEPALPVVGKGLLHQIDWTADVSYRRAVGRYCSRIGISHWINYVLWCGVPYAELRRFTRIIADYNDCAHPVLFLGSHDGRVLIVADTVRAILPNGDPHVQQQWAAIGTPDDVAAGTYRQVARRLVGRIRGSARERLAFAGSILARATPS